MSDAVRRLPDPDWPAMLPSCPACAYNLTGMMPPARCPECGFPIDDKTLILHGVVKADASMSGIRKALWALIAIVGVLLGNGLLVLILIGPISILLVLAWVAGFIAMLTTSKRDRAGRMVIVFAAGGFIVVPELANPGQESKAVGWDRLERVELKRISPVWYRLRLWSGNTKLLDAGVRCPDEHKALVYDTIEAFRTEPAS